MNSGSLAELESLFRHAQITTQHFLDDGSAEHFSQALRAWLTLRTHPNFSLASEEFQRQALDSEGDFYLQCYWAANQPDDLDQAIELWKMATRHAGISPQMQSALMSKIGLGLNERYANNGIDDDLTASIRAYEEALRLLPIDAPDRVIVLNELGGVLISRYRQIGDLGDLTRSISLFEQALQLVAPQSVECALILSNIGTGLSECYAKTGDFTELERSIDAYERALTIVAPDTPERITLLANLSASLRERHDHRESLADLDRAIELGKQALESTSPDEATRVSVLNNLAGAFIDRYDYTGELSDLEQSLASWQAAARLAESNPHNLATIVSNLGIGYRKRYEITRSDTDLENAIVLCKQALQLTTSLSPSRIGYMGNLGTCLSLRYNQRGNREDLDQAIQLFQQALELASATSVSRATLFNSLGLALFDRYARSGNLLDLDEAIQVFVQAIQQTADQSADQAMFLNSMGMALYERYKQTERLSDLKQTIAVFQRVIALVRPGSPYRAAYLNNLGTSLRDYYLSTKKVTDLQQAIEIYHQALLDLPETSADRPAILLGWSLCLSALHAVTGSLADHQTALSAMREAAQSITPADPDSAVFLKGLGNVLRDSYEIAPNAATLNESIGAYESACVAGLASNVETVLTCSHIWGSWALKRGAWEEATRAFSYGGLAIDHLFRIQLLRSAKERWLHEAQGLSSLASYASARCADLLNSVVILEQGLSRLTSEALERKRADLERLPTLNHAVLYQHYQSVVERVVYLEHAQLSTDLSTGTVRMAELRTAHIELDNAVQAIRHIPGYEDLFDAPGFDAIQHNLVEDNHTVGLYLGTTTFGGYALIVHTDGVEAIWLDVFTTADLDSLLVKRDASHIIGGYLLEQLGRAAQTTLDEVLTILGERAIAPVADRLCQQGIRRVVVIPIGLLGLLPLHAARYQHDGREACLLDQFDVVYAPSARILGNARKRLKSRQPTTYVLAGAGNPLGDFQSLRHARLELEEVAMFFAHDVRYTLYEHEAAKEAFLAASQSATYVHLSCHGLFDPQDPLNSHLQLANGDRLTLREVMHSKHFEQARLVVLSACQTAITDFNKLPDEAVGLPTGFFQAGVPGVVGTLWPVDDLSTMLLMVKFYEGHLKEGLAPATALRKAQLWLRDVTNAELSELFNEYRKLPHSEIMRSIAQEQFRNCATREPSEKPYAHPYYWAPFVFYGA